MTDYSFTDSQVGLVISLVGIVLLSVSGGAYAISLVEDPYDYQVSVHPVEASAGDVTAHSLSDTDQQILAESTLVAHPKGSTQAIGAVTTTGESTEPILYDSPPEGFSDGDIIRIESTDTNEDLLVATPPSSTPMTYLVTVTEHREPLNIELFSMFVAGLLVLSGGLRHRSRTK